MKVTTLETLFLKELKDVYDAEKRLTRALPKLAKSAQSPELASAFRDHLEVTRNHVERLEEVFELIEQKPAGAPCAGMKGLIEEGEEMISSAEAGPVLDVGLVAGARRVEHYEMAAYTSLIALAESVGSEAISELLAQNLKEEEEADSLLETLAQSLVAEATDSEEEEVDEETEMEEEEEEIEEEAVSEEAAGGAGRSASVTQAPVKKRANR
jgi:ferritin-like metal-binding protein YciE